MKKLGQKVSFLTKIMLVVGLLISNLSSLSVVFAYEGKKAILIDLADDTLKVSYVEKLAEDVEAVNVKVYENYTYSGGLSEQEVEKVYSLNAEQMSAALAGTLVLEHESIFASSEDDTVKNFKYFDGTYSAKVEIVAVTNPEEESEAVVETEAAVETTEELVTETVSEVVEEVLEIEETNESTVVEENSVVEEVIAEKTFEKEIKYESGLNIKLFDSVGNEIALVDGKYQVSAEDTKVKVVAQILSGGLNPTDVFVYEDVEYIARDLLGLEFVSETDFGGRLFGEYELPVNVTVLKPLPVTDTVSEVAEEIVEVEETVSEVAEQTAIVDETSSTESFEEVVYNESVNILYESYEMNAALLNMVATESGYGESYMFYSDSKAGALYLLSDLGEVNSSETVVTKTMLDLYNMLNVALEEDDETIEPIINYTLVKNGVNVLEAYDETAGESLEDYLSKIALDETVVITLSNKGLEVSYSVVVAGDLNNDNTITKEDVLKLIDESVGVTEVTNLNKSDLYGFDEKVNTLDVIYLNQVVKSQIWGPVLNNVDAILDASLDVKRNGEVISKDNSLSSGDEFTVEYVLSLTDYEVNGVAGLFKYDKSMFELVSVEAIENWVGNSKDGKFLYLGEESLVGPELEVTEPETEVTPDVETTPEIEVETSSESTGSVEAEQEVVSVDYVVIKATFKALKATSEETNNVITLEEIELFNSTEESVDYLVLDNNVLSTEEISVVASDNNNLQYLSVAGVEIALEEGKYEYEITVASDVTAVDLKYMLENVAANITSTVYPEELVEGSNTVVITVTSESGVSQNYTITVIREEVEEETTTQVDYNDYYEDNNYSEDDNNNEEVVTPEVEEPEEDDNDKEDSNLSRIVIIILILLVIAGLVYLIFRDEDDQETKKANKEVNRLKKAALDPEVKKVNKTSNDKVDNKSNNNKNKNSNNKKKER